MKKFYDIYGPKGLFKNISRDDAVKLAVCISAERICYKKGDIVFRTRDDVRKVGVVISGALSIMRRESDSGSSMLARTEGGELFAAGFLCGKSEIPVFAEAAENTEVMWFEYEKMIRSCSQNCPCHKEFISNLMDIFSQKNTALTKRADHLSQRTLKEKVLSYFSDQAAVYGSSFTVPFDRREMAQYFAVDRTTLSAVLSELKREKLIDFKKNHFILI